MIFFRKKMSKMIKKEKRGAIKEIRKDNTFIAQLVIPISSSSLLFSLHLSKVLPLQQEG